MTRRLLNLAALLSLLLCVATVVLWVRSQFRYDIWHTLTRDGATGVTSMAEVDAGNGRVFVQYEYQRQEATGEENTGWHHRSLPHPQQAAVKFDQWWIFKRGEGSSARTGRRWWTLQLRLWPLSVATALFPALWIAFALRRRREPGGMCPRCGYDLRATPGRCPECGTAAAAQKV